MDPTKYTDKQLIFGSGGGFTNQVSEYRLLEDSRLFYRKNNDSSFTELKKQDVKTTKRLLEDAKALFEDVPELNEPGNVYYYIKLKNANNTQQIVWGRANTEVPEKAKDLYKQLMNLVHLNH